MIDNKFLSVIPKPGDIFTETNSRLLLNLNYTCFMFTYVRPCLRNENVRTSDEMNNLLIKSKHC